MRIHSDFRDYYDIGLSVGIDPLLHYNRKEKGVYIPDIKRLFPSGLLSEVRVSRQRVRTIGDVEGLHESFDSHGTGDPERTAHPKIQGEEIASDSGVPRNQTYGADIEIGRRRGAIRERPAGCSLQVRDSRRDIERKR